MRNTLSNRLFSTWMPALFLVTGTSQAFPQENKIFFQGEITDHAPHINSPGMSEDPDRLDSGLFSLLRILEGGSSHPEAVTMSNGNYDLQLEYLSAAKELDSVDVLNYYASYAPEKAKLVIISVH